MNDFCEREDLGKMNLTQETNELQQRTSAGGRGGLFSSGTLHIMAMLFMLLDHLWATVFPYLDFLTCIGRLAFPLFAFMIAEGFYHTGNLKRYIGKIFVFAVISEVPFDLIYGGTVFYPFHQNVLWTFLISLLLMAWMERVRKKNKWILTGLSAAGALILGYGIGTVTMVDYYGAGVLTVLLFYFLRGKHPVVMLLQFAGMYFINAGLLSGFFYTVTVFGHAFEFPQQAFALFALPLIWLYSGERGYGKKWFQYFCYAFYPGHLLALYFIWQSLPR